MEPQAFAVDAMLGRLARWLRVLGHDVAYGPHLRRATLLACARREARLLLTRDTQLLRDPNLPPHLFITSDRFRDQLREVGAVVPLAGGRPFSRCLACNTPLTEVARDAIREQVPAYVFEHQPRFWSCPSCHRLFWPATHHARMIAELAALGLRECA